MFELSDAPTYKMYITYIKRSTYDNIHAYFSIIRQVNYYELLFTNIATYLLCDII